METLKEKLPRGTWLHLGNLPKGTTAEALSTFFADAGMDIPAECFSIRDYRHCSSAILAVGAETVRVLVEWALNGATFEGHAVVPETLRAKP